MLAGRLYGPEDLRIEEVPVPQINDDEILLKVKATAVCGTDVRMFLHGAAGASPDKPLILGHEFAGVIDKLGDRVDSKYEVGQRIAVAPNFGCGTCDFCISGQGHLCPDYQAFGINIDGSFAEYVRIPAQTIRQGNLSIIDDNISFAAGALNEPFSCVNNGFERNNVRPGDKVLVIGAGAIGIMHAMLARMAGAGLVVVNDLSQERLELVKEIDPVIETIDGTVNIDDYTSDITRGKGFDVIVTAAPVPSIQQKSLHLAAVNGRICFFGGLPKSKEEVSLNTNIIHYKQLIISGTTRASLDQYRRTLRFISSGIVDVDKLVSTRGGIKDLLTLIDNAKNAKGLKNVIEF
jgi:L-iditol 2-dehydrogenase